MPKSKTKSPTWTDLKKSIIELNQSQMVSLIKDLYRLSKSNRDFLHVRFSVGNDHVNSYKKIIEKSMYPESGRLMISKAKRVISEYSKATEDPLKKTDLMIFFVECGNRFTIDYGDIEENFYDSLCSMYEKAIKNVISLPEPE